MTKKMKDVIYENRNIIENIMPEVEHILNIKKVEYTANRKETEIVIDTDKNENKVSIDDIRAHLYKVLEIPRMVLDILLDVRKSKKHIYIRLRIKDKK